MKVVLFDRTTTTRRSAGASFDFLADAYAHLGWDVVFRYRPISWLSSSATTRASSTRYDTRQGA